MRFLGRQSKSGREKTGAGLAPLPRPLGPRLRGFLLRLSEQDTQLSGAGPGPGREGPGLHQPQPAGRRGDRAGRPDRGRGLPRRSRARPRRGGRHQGRCAPGGERAIRSRRPTGGRRRSEVLRRHHHVRHPRALLHLRPHSSLHRRRSSPPASPGWWWAPSTRPLRSTAGVWSCCARPGSQVDLAEGDLARRCKRQNNGLRKAVTTGLPFVTYKYAMTLDGRVATDSGDSRWISGAESRALVHQWRAWSDAVVVGAGTLQRDDPRLTARDVDCARQPLRVVVDRSLPDHRGSRPGADGRRRARCWSSAGRRSPRRGAPRWSRGGWRRRSRGRTVPGGWTRRRSARLLAARDVQTVLLEGGPRLAGAWWAAGLIDKVAAFVCPQVVSGGENRAPLLADRGAVAWPTALGLREVEVRADRVRRAHLRLRGGAVLMFTGLVEEVGTVRAARAERGRRPAERPGPHGARGDPAWGTPSR